MTAQNTVSPQGTPLSGAPIPENAVDANNDVPAENIAPVENAATPPEKTTAESHEAPATSTSAVQNTAPVNAAPTDGCNNTEKAGCTDHLASQPHKQTTESDVCKVQYAFTAEKSDGLLVILCAVMGYLFFYWMIFWQESSDKVWFTFVVAGLTLAYAFMRKVKIPRASWFWCGILLLTGLSNMWTMDIQLLIWQNQLLAGSYFYWVMVLFGNLAENKTGNFLPLDVVNAVFVIPAYNFGTVGAGLTALKKIGKAHRKGNLLRRMGAAALGLAFLALLFLGLLPLLRSADSGGFTQMFETLYEGLQRLLFSILLRKNYARITLSFIMGIPVALYLYGLLAGSAHKRQVTWVDKTAWRARGARVRLLPQLTVGIVLLGVSALYVCFLWFQAPYFFSAFAGVKPDAYELYSTYAREGFFELCRVASVNLTMLWVANTACRTPRTQSRPLRAGNIVISLLSLLILLTAFSKMALYIAMLGLTPRRVMTCVFMLFLGGVFVAVIVLQFRQFSIMRVAAVLGCSLLCALCLSNMSGWIRAYNNRYGYTGDPPQSQPAGVAAAHIQRDTTPGGKDMDAAIAAAVFRQAQPVQYVSTVV